MTTQTTETNAAAGGSNGRGRRSRSIMAAGLALGLVAGAGASLAAGWPFAAGASTQSASVTQDAEDHDDPAMVHDDESRPADIMQEVLQTLVDDGTLTQEQVDAIIEALTRAHDDMEVGGDRDGHHGPGMGGPGTERRHPVREVLDTAATFLGLDAKELRAELKSGKTLAEIAEAHGKSRQELIDALVSAGIDAATERLNEQIPRLVDGEVGPRQDS